jgi:hypothetical protein
MKIIDLLNRIANGEEVPKKIKYKDFEYLWHDKSYGYCRPAYNCTYISFFTDFTIYEILDDEVEIIEENKKIKKIDFRTLNTQKEKNRVMKDTINQIIDKLNERDEDV